MASPENKRILRSIAKAIKLFPSVVERKKKAHKNKQAILKRFAPMSRELSKAISKSKKLQPHPWRMCPAGEHWVSAHPMHVPISDKNPTGTTVRDGHCRTNPSRKDQLYSDEMMKIAEQHFHRLENLPSSHSLGRSNGNDFDRLIAGWTQYWNEVLNPETPLDSNLVKALVSTESDFKVNGKTLASKGNWARGLMQVTDQTLEILKDAKGELKDHLIHVDQGDINDPNLNIASGVRWLFHKKSLLEKKLRRTVSWEEAVMEYKSYTKRIRNKEPSAIRQWNKFLERYGKLKNE